MQENYVLDKAVGVTFGNRQSTIRTLKAGDTLKLVKEPDNQYDKTAVRIETEDGKQVGYVKRDSWLTKVVYEKNIVPKVQVHQIIGGGEGMSLGVVMKILKESAV